MSVLHSNDETRKHYEAVITGLYERKTAVPKPYIVKCSADAASLITMMFKHEFENVQCFKPDDSGTYSLCRIIREKLKPTTDVILVVTPSVENGNYLTFPMQFLVDLSRKLLDIGGEYVCIDVIPVVIVLCVGDVKDQSLLSHVLLQ